MSFRKTIIIAALAGVIGIAIPASAETVVRYGISMADIPLTTGQPDRGAGGYQFTGYTIYDPLVAWEMDVADRPGNSCRDLQQNGKSILQIRRNGALPCVRA